MAYTRLKKLTDNTYAPTNPATEAAARSQVDGAIQEAYDMLNTETVGASGADYVKSAPVTGLVGNTVFALLGALKAYADSILAQIQGIVLGQIPDNSLTEAKMANEMKKVAPISHKWTKKWFRYCLRIRQCDCKLDTIINKISPNSFS